MTDVSADRGSPSLADAKRDLLARLLAEAGVAAAEPGVSRRAGDRHPQSFAQELLWLLDRSMPGLTAYNAPIAVRLDGPLDLDVLRRAIDRLVERHEALRTVYDTIEGLPVQRILDDARPEFVTLDFSDRDPATAERVATEALRGATGHAFDLTCDVLLRTTVIRVGPERHLLLLLSHHIAVDGWSCRILFEELSAFYEALRRDTDPALPPLPLRYVDLAAFQREQLAGERLTRLLGYWKGRLDGVEPLQLPIDRPRPTIPSVAGVQRVALLPTAMVDQLHALGREHGATLYMVLLAAYQTLLHRYTGSADVVVGSPVAGRTRRESEPVVGYFVNALALRTSFDGAPTFAEVLARVRETCLGAYDHQDIPLERLVLELGRERATSHAPLFQAFLTMADSTPPAFHADGIRSSAVDLDALHEGSSKFDILLLVSEQPDGLRLLFQARQDLFDGDTLDRFHAHLRTLIEGIVAAPSTPVDALPLLPPAERALLESWAGRGQPAAGPLTVERIVAQASPHRDVAAIIAEDRTLTYGELLQAADRLATTLRAAGVQPADRVGIALERSAAALVAVLGIWRAGAAYVPLGVDLPDARLLELLAQARIGVVVGEPVLGAGRLAARTISAWQDAAEPTPVPAAADADAVAYVLFTSGSTGKPKGVEVTHGNLSAYTEAVSQRLELDEQQPWHFGWVSTVGADLGHTVVYPALASGGCLHVIPPVVATDAGAYGDYVASRPLDVVKLTPSHLRALLSGPAGAAVLPQRWVVVGGEACPWELVEEVKRAGRCRVLNHYGPTETTVGACAFEITDVTAAALRPRTATVPIGRPLRHAVVEVRDGRGVLVPVGVAGELWVGGAGVARGYLGQPELTAERFQGRREGRWYRTGDRVRRLPTGDLEFLGRLDGQVKVRGYRLEVGEVEAVLGQQAGVAQGAVVVHGTGEAAVLVGVYVAGPGAPGVAEHATALRAGLAAELPAYAVPARFVRLDRLPLTANGKRDGRAILAAADTALAELSAPPNPNDEAAPATATELKVTAVWSEILRRDAIGLDDNFFELGGHSLSAIRALGKLSREFGLRLPLRALFEAPTVRGLAAVIDASTTPAGTA